MEKAFEGKLVHYVLGEGPNYGEHRPALIIKVWTEESCNLQVFVDGSNDGFDTGMLWKTSVRPGYLSGYWHPIED